MKNVYICVLLQIASVLGGAYIAVWIMFVGGIVDLVNEGKAIFVNHKEPSAYHIAFGIAKIVFFAVPFYAGFLAAIFFRTLLDVPKAFRKK